MDKLLRTLAITGLSKSHGRRLANYRKLRRELEFELRRDDPTAARENRQIWKDRSKSARRLRQERGH